jgi:hypothetical protein
MSMEGSMRLWHISQETVTGYDTYSDAVVAAETEDDARLIHPYADSFPEMLSWDGLASHAGYGGETWCNAGQVNVRLIGEAVEGTERGVICASFNAG